MVYSGKYRGTVTDNADPTVRGRLRVEVPDVLGVGVPTWAEACLSVSDFLLMPPPLPPIGTSVWVEFAHGDADQPIWSGCCWPAPGAAPIIPGSRMTVQLGDLMVTKDEGHCFILTTKTGQVISIGTAGITLDNGQGASITMSGPTVSINHGALAIT